MPTGKQSLTGPNKKMNQILKYSSLRLPHFKTSYFKRYVP